MASILKQQIIENYPILTGDEIAEKLNIGRLVVYRCLHKNRIELRRPGMRGGNIPWNKGKKLNQEQKAKMNMSGLDLGRAWNKGISMPKEFIEKMRYGLQKWCEEQGHYPNWKGGISYGHKTGYYSSQYKHWRKRVFERDNYTCQDCGDEKMIYLTAHHIKSFAEYPKLRFIVSNGISLCENCHCKIDKYRARFMKKEN